MNLLKDAILSIAQIQQEALAEIQATGVRRSSTAMTMSAQQGMSPEQWLASYRQDVVDFLLSAQIAKDAQTVLFDPDQALLLCRSLERFQDQPFFKLPFDHLIIQFTRPIPETDLFDLEPGHWSNDPVLLKAKIAEGDQYRRAIGLEISPKALEKGDAVLGIVLGESGGYCNASAWFASTESQRVQWRINDPSFEHFINPSESHERPDIAVANKRKLQLLSMAIVFYMNCKNIELEKIAADPKVNRNRANKGKRLLPDYYVCQVKKTHYKVTYGEDAKNPQHSGGTHSFRYDVIGHFRKVGDGAIWIADHQRGIDNLTYKPKVWKVSAANDPRLE